MWCRRSFLVSSIYRAGLLHLWRSAAVGKTLPKTNEVIALVPPIQFTLEQVLEFIGDERVEVTAKSFRLYKKILDENQRKRAAKNRVLR